jgi:CRISPR/Cas system CSM-associated protein Csm3 (group 7 of RAMP superfamily)
MPQLEIHLKGPLLVGGGHAAALGVDATTAVRFQEGRWVPYIPGSALRGAVRQQLEALLSGVGQAVSGPYPVAAGGSTSSPADAVALLFGHSGPDGSRTGSKEGKVRFGDGMPNDATEAAERLTVRPHVSIDDHRGTAEDQKLFFREVADVGGEVLVFTAELDVDDDLSEEHRRWLKAAAETTSALGAAKASGGGAIEIHWQDDGSSQGALVSGDPTTATRARLTLRLLEPAHYGDGGPLGNYHGTRTFLPGATVRGAIAWTLLRAKRTTPESQGFQALFLDEERPVGFGDALVGQGGSAGGNGMPGIVPVTRRRTRDAAGARTIDVLAAELARQRVNQELAQRGQGTYLQAAAGDRKLDPIDSRPAPGLLRRVRTRVSIDRHSATAAEGRLFSIEQLEPWSMEVAGDTSSRSRPVELVATVEGLTPPAAELLARVEGLTMFVGGRRNHGLGKVELEVQFLTSAGVDVEEAVARAEALREQEAAAVASLARRAGLEPLADDGDTTPLALVATTDFVPEEEGDDPLRAWAEAGSPARRFLEGGLVGGYDQRRGHDGRAAEEPLKTLQPTVGAGSVFVYRLPGSQLAPLLERVLPELSRGIGRCRESGCGRFEVFMPLPTAPRSLTTQEEPR